MDIKKVLSMTPNSLASSQHDHLRDHLLGKLNKIIDLVKSKKYEDIMPMLAYSPAGDAHGGSNYYIDFSDTGINEFADIQDVIVKLMELNEIAESKKAKNEKTIQARSTNRKKK